MSDSTIAPPQRIVYLGTPEFALPALKALAETDHDIQLVVTQPDRPSGRGRKLTPPPVKVLAEQLGLKIWQPACVNDSDVCEKLREMKPDLIVVVAFGGLLCCDILELGKFPPINIHPSLLPAYRGPAPINWAVLNGDMETGVSTMMLDEGMDTGPVLMVKKTPIGPDETAGELHDRLAQMGADLLVETINGLLTGKVVPSPQPQIGLSIARMLKKQDGLIDWTRPAEKLAFQIRGLDPWPGAYSTFKGKNVKLFGARPGPGKGEPGQVLALEDGRLHIGAGEGSLAVAELQLAGKKRQNAFNFWQGQRLSQSDFFGEPIEN